MVNFNHQDGFSVFTVRKAPYHHDEQFYSAIKLDKSHEFVANLQENEDENDDIIRNNEEILDELEMENKPMYLDSRSIIENDSFHETPTASSILVVNEVQYKHGGNYTCAPSNTRPTYINVHVLKGKWRG